jgi:hypothetical protein
MRLLKALGGLSACLMPGQRKEFVRKLIIALRVHELQARLARRFHRVLTW